MKHLVSIRLPLTVFFLASLAVSAVAAESGPDDCLQEEKRLRADEVEKCSGMSYIFNPSACFIARKTLDHYTKGTCTPIGDGAGAAVDRLKPVKTVTPTPAAQPTGVASVLPAEAAVPGHVQVTPVKIVEQPTEMELLRREIAGLKAEFEQLKAEVARMRGEK